HGGTGAGVLHPTVEDGVGSIGREAYGGGYGHHERAAKWVAQASPERSVLECCCGLGGEEEKETIVGQVVGMDVERDKESLEDVAPRSRLPEVFVKDAHQFSIFRGLDS
ncbi:hypothetical protein HAX54_015793, partial [Datura stramonium]|nr:hypothetical protein [Datura stramonium]